MSHASSSRPFKWRAVLSTALLAAAGWFASPAQAATYTCTTGADFQAKLNDATVVLGDTIVLVAGTTYTPTGSGFSLPLKTGSGYLTIQSSALASLPAGLRVSASDEQYMPKIQAQSGQGSYSAIRTATGGATGPHHYKFLGIAMTSSADNIQQTTIVRVGDESSTQNLLAEVPNNFIFDRCIIRANSTTSEIRHGINLDAAYVDITNCRIYDIKALITSGDSTGISGSNGPGPFNIINNYIEAASENFLLGGATCSIQDVIPSDIVIRKNHFNKPFSAWQSSSWNVKNLFELKAGQRIHVEGNLFENSWGNLQEGKAITLKTVRQSGQGSAWTDTKDITIVNNLVRNVGVGFSIGGSTNTSGGSLNGTPWNITVRNNLFDNVNNTMPSNPGELVNLSSGPVNVTLDHITGFATNMIADVSGASIQGFVWTNNMTHQGANYAFKGAATGGDSDNCFNTFFGAPSPISYLKNVVKGGSINAFTGYDGTWSPASLAFPTTWTGVLVNQASPGTNYAGYGVPDGSSYDNTGTDGLDIGCNVSDVMASIIGCSTGILTHAGYEGFNYAGTSTLDAKKGGADWNGVAWVQAGGYANPTMSAGSLTYTDSSANKLLTGGNKLAPASNSRATRNFPATLVTSGKTYWASFRIKQTAGTFPSNHAGFSLFSGTAGGGNEIFIGKPSTSANWGIAHIPTSSTAVVTGTPNFDVFLVCKMVFTGSQVTISLWVNPILNEGSLGTAHATLANKAHTTNIASLRISTGTNSTNYQFDEFRLGTTFADIAPKQ